MACTVQEVRSALTGSRARRLDRNRVGDTDASHIWAITFRDAGLNAAAREESPFCASLAGDISRPHSGVNWPVCVRGAAGTSAPAACPGLAEGQFGQPDWLPGA